MKRCEMMGLDLMNEVGLTSAWFEARARAMSSPTCDLEGQLRRLNLSERVKPRNQGPIFKAHHDAHYLTLDDTLWNFRLLTPDPAPAT